MFLSLRNRQGRFLVKNCRTNPITTSISARYKLPVYLFQDLAHSLSFSQLADRKFFKQMNHETLPIPRGHSRHPVPCSILFHQGRPHPMPRSRYGEVNTFSVSQEDTPLTKAAQSVADYTAVKSITLAFFNSDGSEQYKSTQLRSSTASFGDFSLTLPYGSYKMIVIARRGLPHHAQQPLRSEYRRREAQRHVPL